MNKQDELSLPTSCLNKAEHHEPIFVLRAKDPIAAQAVRLWAAMAHGHHEPEKVLEAIRTAEQMDAWRSDWLKVTTPGYGQASVAKLSPTSNHDTHRERTVKSGEAIRDAVNRCR